MRATDVQLLLDTCDRSTAVGVRNFALYCWSHGSACARSRSHGWSCATWTGAPVSSWFAARRDDTTGCRYRPKSAKRWSPTCRVAAIRACLRAGLPHVGPHRLRHALAGELLRQGAGLVALSQVLRHRNLATTALYARGCSPDEPREQGGGEVAERGVVVLAGLARRHRQLQRDEMADQCRWLATNDPRQRQAVDRHAGQLASMTSPAIRTISHRGLSVRT